MTLTICIENIPDKDFIEMWNGIKIGLMISRGLDVLGRKELQDLQPTDDLDIDYGLIKGVQNECLKSAYEFMMLHTITRLANEKKSKKQ